MSTEKIFEETEQENYSKMLDAMVTHNQATDSSLTFNSDEEREQYKQELSASLDKLAAAETNEEIEQILEENKDNEVFNDAASFAATQMKPEEYVVRGALLRCSSGSHHRKLNLPKCHGVYIGQNPVMHSGDCEVGIDAKVEPDINITSFGICNGTNSTPNDTDQSIVLFKEVLDENGHPIQGETSKDTVKGVQCKACIQNKTWEYAHNSTKIGTNGHYALTTNSFLVCQHGGVIMVITSGQENEDNEPITDEFLKLQEKLAKEARTIGVANMNKDELDLYISMYEKMFPSDKEVMDKFLEPLALSKKHDLTRDIQNIKLLSYIAPQPYKGLMFETLPNIDIWEYDSSKSIFANEQFALPIADAIVVDIVGSDRGAYNPRGPYFTLFHEIGHQIDYQKINTSGLQNTIKSDVHTNIKNKIAMYNTDNDPNIANIVFNSIINDKPPATGTVEGQIYYQVIEQYKTETIKNDQSHYHNTVSDIYGAHTENTLGKQIDGYGHENYYWDFLNIIVDADSLELFAGCFASNITGYQGHIDATHKYFPNAIPEMERRMYEYMGLEYGK